MSFIPAGFRFGFAASVLGAAVLGLSACQPVLQAQSGRTVPVVFPAQSPAEPAEAVQTSTDDTASSSTVLTADEAAADPDETKASLLPQTNADEQNAVAAQSEDAVIVVRRPVQPAVTPAFNPADLVGKAHGFVNAQFGQADFSRTEGVIHVLQYRQPDCVIDLFISVADTAQTPPPADAKIMAWAMRERTVNQPLDLTLCQQQFFDRKL